MPRGSHTAAHFGISPGVMQGQCLQRGTSLTTCLWLRRANRDVFSMPFAGGSTGLPICHLGPAGASRLQGRRQTLALCAQSPVPPQTPDDGKGGEEDSVQHSGNTDSVEKTVARANTVHQLIKETIARPKGFGDNNSAHTLPVLLRQKLACKHLCFSRPCCGLNIWAGTGNGPCCLLS